MEHFGTQLVVVLGHNRCGAVSAALSDGKAPGHIGAVAAAIKPAVAKTKDQPGDPVENAVRANVLSVVHRLETAPPILSVKVKAGKLQVIGACYSLDNGQVKPVE